jgi:hypothetical protein
MKKVPLVIIFSLMFLFSFGTYAVAELAKEGTFSGKEYHSGTYKILAIENHLHMTFEAMGVFVNDAGEGLLHKSSDHCIGALHAVDGNKDEETWFVVFTDLDGDKACIRCSMGGKLLESAKGTFTFAVGTGKYAGIEGSGEVSWSPVKAAVEGTYQGIITYKGHYKLP